MRNGIVSLNNKLMELAYVKAIGRYNSGTGKPLTFNVNSLGLENLCLQNLSRVPGSENKYTVNLLNPNVLTALLANKTTEEQIKTLSTALTLGNITLTRVYGNQFRIENDTYDFDMHSWENETGRNLATIIGFCVSEGMCIAIDSEIRSPLGKVLGRNFDIAMGLVRRHILGTTRFFIYFSGTIVIN